MVYYELRNNRKWYNHYQCDEYGVPGNRFIRGEFDRDDVFDKINH